MAYSAIYRKQVAHLVKVLPYVAKERCFALKGGTAINLFIRNLPRLSVDIDLTYLPVAERAQSLKDIDAALKRIAEYVKAIDGSVHITASAPITQKQATKLVIRTKDRVQIKNEVTPVLRDVGQEYAQNFASMTVSSIELETLHATRDKLINDLVSNMPQNHKSFLYSFYERRPDWSLLGLENAQTLPAARWRELNLDRSGEGTRETLLAKLKQVIDT